MFKKIKLELFFIRKVFKRGGFNFVFLYIKNKYFVAPKIKDTKGIEAKDRFDLSIHSLTCKRDLIMSIWSYRSFFEQLDFSGDFFIHNDGSLNENDKNMLLKHFPFAKVIDPDKFEEKYSVCIKRKIPKAYEFRFSNKYVLLKKLIDPLFVASSKNILIIDSDMLWYRIPLEIVENIKNNSSKSLLMQMEKFRSPVYFKNNLEMPDDLDLLNTGIVSFNIVNFDFEKLENYFESIDEMDNRNSHYIEQFAFAYCLNNREGLDYRRYKIKGCKNDSTLMRHYTSVHRFMFYIEGLNLLKSKYLK